MRTVLVVVRPFAGHAVGDVISDDKEASQIAAGEHAHCVVRVLQAQVKLDGGEG